MKQQLNISGSIPRDLIDADDALTRYGRWASDRDHRRRCGSAERQYRPDSWHAVERRRTPAPISMQVVEALICQRALARVPDLERIVLAVLYVPQRLPPEAQLRILRIPPQLCQVRHLQGLRMFDNLHKLLQPRGEVVGT